MRGRDQMLYEGDGVRLEAPASKNPHCVWLYVENSDGSEGLTFLSRREASRLAAALLNATDRSEV